MPMDRSLYPENWESIALAIKENAGWKCQQCGRPCRKAGESFEAFQERVRPHLYRWSGWDGIDPIECILEKRQAWTLTVAHLNHIPSDCSPENLRAWCSGCHCRYDLAQMAVKKRLKRERAGQLRLEGV